MFGESKVVELTAVGAGVALTAENRKEYVDLIAKQFNVGFRRIVTRLFFGFVAWSLCFR